MRVVAKMFIKGDLQKLSFITKELRLKNYTSLSLSLKLAKGLEARMISFRNLSLRACYTLPSHQISSLLAHKHTGFLHHFFFGLTFLAKRQIFSGLLLHMRVYGTLGQTRTRRTGSRDLLNTGNNCGGVSRLRLFLYMFAEPGSLRSSYRRRLFLDIHATTRSCTSRVSQAHCFGASALTLVVHFCISPPTG